MTTEQWHASLKLGYTRREQATLLTGRSHRGPLRVQRPLYPEGPELCHTLMLHPPGGIAGGDDLHIQVDAAADTSVLLTTPGATKWYRSGGRTARQRTELHLGKGASLEWLPQENIFFDGTEAELALSVHLADDAVFLGLETACLGRIAAAEIFTRGTITLKSQLIKAGKLIWREQGFMEGGSDWLHALPGLAGYPLFATLLVVAPNINKELLDQCRAVEAGADIVSGLSLLPEGLLVGRCLGQAAEPLRAWFLRLWQVLRPALMHRQAIVPRIWNT